MCNFALGSITNLCGILLVRDSWLSNLFHSLFYGLYLSIYGIFSTRCKMEFLHKYFNIACSSTCGIHALSTFRWFDTAVCLDRGCAGCLKSIEKLAYWSLSISLAAGWPKLLLIYLLSCEWDVFLSLWTFLQHFNWIISLSQLEAVGKCQIHLMLTLRPAGDKKLKLLSYALGDCVDSVVSWVVWLEKRCL